MEWKMTRWDMRGMEGQIRFWRPCRACSGLSSVAQHNLSVLVRSRWA